MTERINEGLRNFLEDNSGGYRVPCYLREDGLYCYFSGGAHFIFDISTQTIKLLARFSQTQYIDDFLLDTDTLNAIVKQIIEQSKTSTSYINKLKQELRIEKKSLRAKDFATIEKYYDALRNKEAQDSGCR